MIFSNLAIRVMLDSRNILIFNFVLNTVLSWTIESEVTVSCCPAFSATLSQAQRTSFESKLVKTLIPTTVARGTSSIPVAAMQLA